jgi:putative transposase
MTIGGLERWLALFITGVYHQNGHSALDTTPIEQYEKGIFGTDEILGRGFPLAIRDEDRLRLDFMPAIKRTVQEYGVMISEIHYYSSVLNRWAKAVEDPQNPRKKRKFIFKRDPRDISVIYFYDPELQQFFKVPYRDTSRPPMSIWEYREIRRRLKAQGKKKVDEVMIFETYAQMRAIEAEESRTSKIARRNEQRRRSHQQIPKPKVADEMPKNITGEGQLDDEKNDWSSDIKPFDEIEEL